MTSALTSVVRNPELMILAIAMLFMIEAVTFDLVW